MGQKIQRAFQVFKEQGWASFVRKLSNWIRQQMGSIAAQPHSKPLSVLEYARWIEAYEPDSAELAKQTHHAVDLYNQPVISIIIPIYNPQPGILEAALNSLLAQTYPYWQACIAFGGSTHQGVHQVLEKYCARDRRFEIVWLNNNLGISGNSNAALEIASGEFVAFLDQDDELAPFALWEIVHAINDNPDCDLIYSDHDLLSAVGGKRCQPLFKPDWSPEIMLSANYLTHLTVVRTTLVNEVGDFNPQLDGAQDWDLFLRLSENARKIIHIPKILYHWRSSPGSTAENISHKPSASKAQIQAITQHLTRLKLHRGQAFFDSSGYLRVRWDFNRHSKVSIIIPSRGASHLLKVCLKSILKITQYPNYEIIIVNNGPQRPEKFHYYRHLGKYSQVKIIHYDGPFNYAAANNFGAQHANGEILVFLNNDTRISSPDWLDELSMWGQRPEVGAVGAKLIHQDGTIQHVGVILGLTGFAGHIFGGQPENQFGIFGRAEWYRDVLAVTGACLAIRRHVFEQLGGFDEKMVLCGNDVALCLKLIASDLRVVYNPFVRLLHLESATRLGDIPALDFLYSYPYYRPYLASGDPYFNPNLSYWHLEPTLSSSEEITPLEFVHDFLKSRNLLTETKYDEDRTPGTRD
jgi:GT2 family glycosyltransferase